MKLLSTEKNAYKANLHCHTTDSDGALSPEEIREHYKALGYSVVAYTDHELFLDRSRLCEPDFLALNGVEKATRNNGKDTHFCAIALDPDNLLYPCWGEADLHDLLGKNALRHIGEVRHDQAAPDYVRVETCEGTTAMIKRFRDAGFFVTYNHPTWSQETAREYMNYHGMHAMEILNNDCRYIGFEEYNPRVYNEMLVGGERIYCLMTDDNHRLCTMGGGWIVLFADALEYRSVTAALERGDFYASEGPAITDFSFDGKQFHLSCSPASEIFAITGQRYSWRFTEAEYGSPLTEAVFTPKEGDLFVRFTVVDHSGKHACTNAVFYDTLGMK